ncbi:unnamed protein product, partial [Amoebophrya sp. A25]
KTAGARTPGGASRWGGMWPLLENHGLSSLFVRILPSFAKQISSADAPETKISDHLGSSMRAAGSGNASTTFDEEDDNFSAVIPPPCEMGAPTLQTIREAAYMRQTNQVNNRRGLVEKRVKGHASAE